jgi:hypothetical protein
MKKLRWPGASLHLCLVFVERIRGVGLFLEEKSNEVA